MPEVAVRLLGIKVDARETTLNVLEGYVNEKCLSSNTSPGQTSHCIGLDDINEYFKENINELLNHKIFVLYDVKDPQKEQHIEASLQLVKTHMKSNLEFHLVSIGKETAPLSAEIRSQFSRSSTANISASASEDIAKPIMHSIYTGIAKAHEKKFLAEQKEFTLKQNKDKFNKQLSIIKAKASSLHRDGHETAADVADELIKKLTVQSNQYFADPTEDAYRVFKTQAKIDITDSFKELGKHRGWKKVLGNIVLAILGFGIIYAVAVVINKGLFFNQTDSVKKLNDFDRLIENNTYKLNF